MVERENITLNKIRARAPCVSGWETLLTYLGKTRGDDEPLSLAVILESNGILDTLWCLRLLSMNSIMERKLAGLLAAFVAFPTDGAELASAAYDTTDTTTIVNACAADARANTSDVGYPSSNVAHVTYAKVLRVAVAGNEHQKEIFKNWILTNKL